MRVAGVPFDQGRHPQGPLTPTAVVLHRTYGALGQDQYRGAYSVGKFGRSGMGIGFHFLIGRNEGQWVQFYDTSIEAAHAKGANSWSIGIEFDGVNEDALSDWQVRAGAIIAAAISDRHGISLTYYDGARKRVNGFLPHASVPGSTHTDRVTRGDWDRILAATNRPVCNCPPAQLPPPPAAVDWNAVRRLSATDILNRGLGNLPTLKQGATGEPVRILQDAINLVSGRGLVADGNFGPATDKAVRDYQRWMGLASDGVFGDKSRFFLTLSVQKVRAGQA